MITHTYIYGLKDPRSNEIFYVGKSNYPELRLKAHITDKDTNPYKTAWIEDILSNGFEPELEILERIPLSGWENAEIKWIEIGKERGWQLTNIAPGGIGLGVMPPQKSHSDFIREFAGNNLADRFDNLSPEKQKSVISAMAFALLHQMSVVEKAYKYYDLKTPIINGDPLDVMNRIINGDDLLYGQLKNKADGITKIVVQYNQEVNGWDV